MQSVYATRHQIWIGGCSLTEARHADEGETREGAHGGWNGTDVMENGELGRTVRRI